MNFIQTQYNIENIVEQFDEYIAIQNEHKNLFYEIIYKANIYYRINNLYKFIKKYREYKNKVFDVLDSIKPDAIVVTTDMLLISRDICLWAQSRNISFIVYQSAFLESPKNNIVESVKNYLYKQFFNTFLKIPLARYNKLYGNEFESSYLFLWGEYFSQNYFGYKDESLIKIIGNPYYESIISRSEDNIKRLYNSFPSNNLFILICTNDLKGFLSKEEIDKLFIIYRSIVDQNPNSHFCFKIHPGESSETYSALFEGLQTKNYSIESEKTVEQLLPITNIQISVGSLTSFEAVLAGIPIIIINSRLLDIVDHFNHKIEERINNIAELQEKIIDMNSKNYYEQFLNRRSIYLENIIQTDSVNSFNKEINSILTNGLH